MTRTVLMTAISFTASSPSRGALREGKDSSLRQNRRVEMDPPKDLDINTYKLSFLQSQTESGTSNRPLRPGVKLKSNDISAELNHAPASSVSHGGYLNLVTTKEEAQVAQTHGTLHAEYTKREIKINFLANMGYSACASYPNKLASSSPVNPLCAYFATIIVLPNS